MDNLLKAHTYRALYLVNSLVGMPVTSLVPTYVMEVYNTLRQRNAPGLKLHLLTNETADAAEHLARLGPRGQFTSGYTHLADIAGGLGRGEGSRFVVTKPINGDAATAANGGTIGFAMDGPDEAQAWHAAGVANGGTSVESPPGERQTPMGRIYLAYLRDPDGNKLCARCKVAD